jgi:tRNA pseudouridine13 synthase
MYKLKQIPEDFIVKEVSYIRLENNGKLENSGRFLYYTLLKRNKNTLDVVKELARKLNVKEKQIGFAGSKDKHAVTEQMISISGVSKNIIETVKVENVTLKFIGKGNEPVCLGDLQGNNFEIVVRNLPNDAELPRFNTDHITNYFDEQRFSENNVKIGRCLVRKEFKKAVELVDDENCQRHLVKYNNDFIGSLKKISLRLLRMYVHAYQSFLWNESVTKYLEHKSKKPTTTGKPPVNIPVEKADFKVIKKVKYSQGKFVFVDMYKEVKIPLIGFDEIKCTNEIDEIIKEMMNKEQITFHDFIIKQIPEISTEGEFRNIFVKVEKLQISTVSDDELNEGMKKVKVSFNLPKGSYATIVIKSLFK